MRVVRAGLELGVSLGCHEPGMILNLYHFYEAVIRQGTGNHHAALGEFLTVLVVELIAMAMTFLNIGRTVCCEGMRTFAQGAGVGTKAHRAALVPHRIRSCVHPSCRRRDGQIR